MARVCPRVELGYRNSSSRHSSSGALSLPTCQLAAGRSCPISGSHQASRGSARYRSVRGFKTLKTAYATIKGFEARHALRKNQMVIFEITATFAVRRRLRSRRLRIDTKPCGSSVSGSNAKRPEQGTPNRGRHAILSSVCNSAPGCTFFGPLRMLEVAAID